MICFHIQVSGASELFLNGFLRRLSTWTTRPTLFPFCPATHPPLAFFLPLPPPPLRAPAVMTDSTDGACKSIQQRLRGRQNERERCTNRSMSPLIPTPSIYNYQLFRLECVVVSYSRLMNSFPHASAFLQPNPCEIVGISHSSHWVLISAFLFEKTKQKPFYEEMGHVFIKLKIWVLFLYLFVCVCVSFIGFSYFPFNFTVKQHIASFFSPPLYFSFILFLTVWSCAF